MDLFFWIVGIILILIIAYCAFFEFIGHGRPAPFTEYRNKHVIITGGSAGLGKSLAIQMSAKGANISLIARNIEKLKQAKEEVEKARLSKEQKISIFAADASKWTDLESAINNAIAASGAPDLIIANAGQSFPGYFAELPIGTIEKETQLNYVGVLYTVKAALPSMIKRNNGGLIVIISSAAAFAPMIGYASYASTKAAIKALADGLRNELLLYGIGVSIFYPTGIDTEGFAEENKGKPKETKEIEAGAAVSKASDVAKTLMDGLAKGRYYITNEVMTELMRIPSHGMIAARNSFVLDLILTGIVVFISPAIRFWMDSVVKRSRSKANLSKKQQ